MSAADRPDFMAHIPRAAGVDDYVPIDAAQREQTYRLWSGDADAWPIPLTPAGEQATAR